MEKFFFSSFHLHRGRVCRKALVNFGIELQEYWVGKKKKRKKKNKTKKKTLVPSFPSFPSPFSLFVRVLIFSSLPFIYIPPSPPLFFFPFHFSSSSPIYMLTRCFLWSFFAFRAKKIFFSLGDNSYL